MNHHRVEVISTSTAAVANDSCKPLCTKAWICTVEWFAYCSCVSRDSSDQRKPQVSPRAYEQCFVALVISWCWNLSTMWVRCSLSLLYGTHIQAPGNTESKFHSVQKFCTTCVFTRLSLIHGKCTDGLHENETSNPPCHPLIVPTHCCCY